MTSSDIVVPLGHGCDAEVAVRLHALQTREHLLRLFPVHVAIAPAGVVELQPFRVRVVVTGADLDLPQPLTAHGCASRAGSIAPIRTATAAPAPSECLPAPPAVADAAAT